LSQRIDATLHEPASPQRDLTAIQTNLQGDLLVLPAPLNRELAPFIRMACIGPG
jgi:hypothetical protein